MSSSPVTFYDFDGAVINILQRFGENPLNKVFLARYLTGLHHDNQATPRSMDDRLVPVSVTNAEELFWNLFRDVYRVVPSDYAAACIEYLDFYAQCQRRSPHCSRKTNANLSFQ